MKVITELLIICQCIIVSESVITKGEVSRIKADLRRIIVGRRAAHMVRAVFHDCVGGCDGCLNRDNLFNQGLPDTTNWMATVDLLDNVYNWLYRGSGLSRADVYVLAAEAGISNAVDRANVGCAGMNCTPAPAFNFRYGRQDCSDDGRTSANRSFPTGHLNQSEVFDFFGNNFGFSTKDTVAIMGAHTLGGATGFTGWRGFWKGVQLQGEVEGNKFNNDYYNFLVDPDLQFVQQASPQIPGFDKRPRFQWHSYKFGEMQSFALNSDLALLKDITTNSEGQSSCTYDSCRRSRGAAYVREFARDKGAFILGFEAAWEKLSSSGYFNLREPVEDDSCWDSYWFCPYYADESRCLRSEVKKKCAKSCNDCSV